MIIIIGRPGIQNYLCRVKLSKILVISRIQDHFVNVNLYWWKVFRILVSYFLQSSNNSNSDICGISINLSSTLYKSNIKIFLECSPGQLAWNFLFSLIFWQLNSTGKLHHCFIRLYHTKENTKEVFLYSNRNSDCITLIILCVTSPSWM